MTQRYQRTRILLVIGITAVMLSGACGNPADTGSVSAGDAAAAGVSDDATPDHYLAEVGGRVAIRNTSNDVEIASVALVQTGSPTAARIAHQRGARLAWVSYAYLEDCADLVQELSVDRDNISLQGKTFRGAQPTVPKSGAWLAFAKAAGNAYEERDCPARKTVVVRNLTNGDESTWALSQEYAGVERLVASPDGRQIAMIANRMDFKPSVELLQVTGARISGTQLLNIPHVADGAIVNAVDWFGGRLVANVVGADGAEVGIVDATTGETVLVPERTCPATRGEMGGGQGGVIIDRQPIPATTCAITQIIADASGNHLLLLDQDGNVSRATGSGERAPVRDAAQRGAPTHAVSW